MHFCTLIFLVTLFVNEELTSSLQIQIIGASHVCILSWVLLGLLALQPSRTPEFYNQFSEQFGNFKFGLIIRK